MYFSNPAIIKNFNDVKLAMIEVDAKEICFLELVALIKYRLERLLKEEVDEMVKGGSLTRKEALDMITLRAAEYLELVDKHYAENESELVKKIMKECLNYSAWESQLWDNFQAIHQDKIQMTTKIPTHGVLTMPQDLVMDALEELSFQGILEVLAKYGKS